MPFNMLILLDSVESTNQKLHICSSLFGQVQIFGFTCKFFIHFVQVVHVPKSDARLANNDLPLDIQRLRCRSLYHALRFTTPIENLGKVRLLIYQVSIYSLI